MKKKVRLILVAYMKYYRERQKETTENASQDT
jgi:hypothetical protein